MLLQSKAESEGSAHRTADQEGVARSASWWGSVASAQGLSMAEWEDGSRVVYLL